MSVPDHLLAGSLRSARFQFAALGLMGGTWGAHIPSIKRGHALDEAALAIVLLAAAIGCVATLGVAGRALARLGTRRTTALAALVMGASLAAVLPAPGYGWLLLDGFALGASMALFDVCINSEGAALEARGGRAVMSQLHALWSLGAMGGALAASALLAAGVAPKAQLAGVAGGVAAAMLVAARGMQAAPPAEPGQAHFTWPNRRLLLIGALILAGMVAEGAMYDWSVLYLAQELGLAQSVAALGYAAFCLAMAGARFAGDALRERFDERALLLAGALLAAASMTLVLLARSPWVAFPGFVLVGAGLAPVAPILVMAAARVGGASPAASIASATSVGTLGFMLGPPLVGAIAQAASLSAALGVVVAAALALAVGVRRLAAPAVPGPRNQSAVTPTQCTPPERPPCP